jgi:hypothetical protein
MLPKLQSFGNDTETGRIYPRLSKARLETAEYIREMTRQMADMAGGNRMPVVQFFLEMAYLEVHDAIRGARPQNGKTIQAELDAESTKQQDDERRPRPLFGS